MRLYRITKAQYAKNLTGEGARKAGGRWNPKGTAVVYAASSSALATLEAVVHSPLNLVPKNRCMTLFELPDHLPVDNVDMSRLPANWTAYPPPPETARLGKDWVDECRTVALKVPSAIVPDGDEWNYLLNPLHPGFKEIEIIDYRPYTFDPRLYIR